MEPTIRPARLDDADAVESFTEDTWPDRGGDYVPRVFESWVRTDGEDARTLVAADADDRAVGLVRTVLLSPSEAWSAGMRVDPEYRGEGVAVRLAEAGFDWARDHGATVGRCMVFSWNAAGLAVARAAGFEPATEFRWAHPEPAAEFWRRGADAGDVHGGADRADSLADARVDDSDAVWEYWQDSEAFAHLGGLALDPDEPWALSSLSRVRIEAAADEGRLLAVGAGDAGRVVPGVEVGGVRGFAVRVRVTDREVDDGPGEVERWVDYGVADWATPAAAEALFDVIARDAAVAGADRTRVLIPETVRAVSDAALARVEVAESPDFVLAADLHR
ncbi:MAG TPA: GNAT family N-acetyltransferase [Halobacteriales archaeon]|nr:GNAT family N-acetyltransferase [Halobacteriales archaeon]